MIGYAMDRWARKQIGGGKTLEEHARDVSAI
jgi:hypothetical protein